MTWLTLLVALTFSPVGDKFADGDFTIGPDYANAPELTVKDGVPRGAVTQFVMYSGDSKIYPGIAKRRNGVVPYKRKVWSTSRSNMPPARPSRSSSPRTAAGTSRR